MSLAGTLSPVGTEVPGRLLKNVTGESLLPSIPQNDPIAAQKVLCLAIKLLVQSGQHELAQLDTLFALEPQAQSVSKLLLTRYVEGDGKLRSFDWRAWQAAIRLSQAFYQTHDHFLRYIWSTTDGTWTKHEPSVLVQLFHHRKVEFLLRFLRYKKRNSGQWRELHAMYLRAHEADLSNRPEANRESDHGLSDCRKTATTIPADPAVGGHEQRPVFTSRSVVGAPLVCALVQWAGRAVEPDQWWPRTKI